MEVRQDIMRKAMEEHGVRFKKDAENHIEFVLSLLFEYKEYATRVKDEDNHSIKDINEAYWLVKELLNSF